MFISILANMSILLVSVYGYLSYYVNYNKFHSFLKDKGTFFNSIFVTIVGIFLLYFAIEIGGARYDLRFLLLAFTVKYFGNKVTITSTLLLMVIRLFWGIDNYTPIAICYSVLLVFTLPMLKYIVSKINSDIIQLLILNYYCLLIGNFLNAIIIKNPLRDINIYLHLYVISTILVFVLYYMINDIKKMQKKATHDYLTKMKNRSEFQAKLEVLQKKKNIFSLAILDIDYFKVINDSFNHLVGDLVLIEVSKVLLSFEGNRINCYRIGGEEFSLVFEEINFVEVENKLEKIRLAVQKINIDEMLLDGEVRGITVSIGVSHIKTFSNIENYISSTDDALYKAKENGRNQLVVGK